MNQDRTTRSVTRIDGASKGADGKIIAGPKPAAGSISETSEDEISNIIGDFSSTVKTGPADKAET